MAITTTADMTDADIQIVDETFLFELQETAVADALATKAIKDDFGVYQVPIYDNLGPAATPKGENPLLSSELNGQGVRNVEFQPAKEADGIGYTEEADIVTGGKLKLAVAQNVGRAAGLTRGLRAAEALAVNLDSAGGSCIQANDLTPRDTAALATIEITAANKASVDLMDEALIQLQSQFAQPFEGQSYFALCDIRVIGAIKKDPKWVSAKNYADPQSVISGEVGELNGIRYIRDDQAISETDGASSARVYRTQLLGFNAFGLAQHREDEMIAGNIPTDLVKSEWYAAYKMYIQYKIVQRAAMITVLSA